MNREKQLQLYQDFIINCTSNEKSIKNYTSFKRINECLKILFPEKQEISILDFDNPVDFNNVLEELFQLPEFIEYDKAGNKQYSNALKHYLRFLHAKKLFSDTPKEKIANSNNNLSLQQIYYGAPGTGKSHTIKNQTAEANKDGHVIRTTFHPDSDYSTFVGCYKPTTIEVPMRDVTGKVIKENDEDVTETHIVYEFVSQAFLEAYVNAWKLYAEAQEGEQPQPQYLIIEEINRGNCAQIFGDLFQLLDRNGTGFSDYPIKADNDLKKQLAKAFKGLSIIKKEEINAQYNGKDVVEKVLNGEELLLPNNLYIWATMNTSDQSLFPIDSAFKRRWEWKYVPISDGKEEWKIEVNKKRYDWWQFLQKINEQIETFSHSEDKKLGYFFCKAINGTISAETFVGKVIFYIWNDVFKDFADEAGSLFKDIDNSTLSFNKFYTVDVAGNAVVNEAKVALFLQNLGVNASNEEETDDEEDETSNETNSKHKHLRSVVFSDGTIFSKEKENIKTQFDIYLESLKKIGLDTVCPLIAEMKYQRKGCPMVSTEKQSDILESNTYEYHQEGKYYIVKGAHDDTLINILEELKAQLNLDIEINFE